MLVKLTSKRGEMGEKRGEKRGEGAQHKEETEKMQKGEKQEVYTQELESEMKRTPAEGNGG